MKRQVQELQKLHKQHGSELSRHEAQQQDKQRQLQVGACQSLRVPAGACGWKSVGNKVRDALPLALMFTRRLLSSS